MRSRKGAAMYRIILKSKSYEYDKETGHYKNGTAETRFDCKDLDQAMGLLELMICTADGLDFSIWKTVEEAE